MIADAPYGECDPRCWCWGRDASFGRGTDRGVDGGWGRALKMHSKSVMRVLVDKVMLLSSAAQSVAFRNRVDIM